MANGEVSAEQITSDPGQFIEFLPPHLAALLSDLLGQLARGFGAPEGTLEAQKNQARLEAKSRERALLQRLGDQFAATGLGGGLLGQGQRDISRDISNALFGKTTAIDVADAERQATARRAALQSALGLGNIAARNRATAAQRKVGLAQVGVQRRRLEMERTLQEFLINSQLSGLGGLFGPGIFGGGGFFGFPSGLNFGQPQQGSNLFGQPQSEFDTNQPFGGGAPVV